MKGFGVRSTLFTGVIHKKVGHFHFLLTEPGAKAISSRLGQELFHPSQAVSDLFLAEANGDIDATILIM